MEKVKRYDLDCDRSGCTMKVSKCGDYIESGDYDRLLQITERAVVALHMHFHGSLNGPLFDECRKDLCGEWHTLVADKDTNPTQNA